MAHAVQIVPVGTTPEYDKSAHTPTLRAADWLFFNRQTFPGSSLERLLAAGVPQRDWATEGGILRAMTPEELQVRTDAKAATAATRPPSSEEVIQQLRADVDALMGVEPTPDPPPEEGPA